MKLNPKQIIYILLGIITIICLLYLYSLSRSVPTQYPSDQSKKGLELPVTRPDSQKVEVDQITFSPNLVFPATPSEIKIYSGSIIENDVNLMAKSLVDKYSLDKKYPGFDLWTDKTNTISLVVDNKNKTLLFSSLRKSNIIFGVESLLKKAQAFMSLTKFSPTYLFQNSKIEYFKSDGNHYEAGSNSDFSLITIPFAPVIDTIPVIIDSLDIEPVTISVNINGEIEKAYFQDKLVKIGDPTETVKLISYDLLKERVNKGKFQIIGASSTSPYVTSITDVPNIEIQEIDLQYRFNTETKIISPYFHLTGVSPTGESVQLLVNAQI
jgi:hypothetical protein